MKKFLLLGLALISLQVHAQLGAGGPDAYGYTWKDSNEPGGPTFAWYNITTIGTQVTGLSDDNVVGPFGFVSGFQYYWYNPEQVWIGSNGYLSFNGANIASPFPTIPSTVAPQDFIAPLLSDLNFSGAANPGTCYYHVTGDTICVSWINVPFWVNANPAYTGSNSFQVILNKADSSITFNYLVQSGLTQSNDITIGIENITGQLGLQHSKNVYPTANYSIKFYYPQTVTYQATDGGVNWNLNEGNGAMFTKTNSPKTLVSNIKNFGNQPLSNIAVSSTVTRTGFTTLNNTSAVGSLSPGQDTALEFTNTLTPPTPGIYNMNTVISGITGDLVAANNTLRTKIIAVDTTALSIDLDYSDGAPDGAGLSWSGGSGGIGYYITPPFYPCKIDAYRMYITADATMSGCILKIFDDNGLNNGPGTMLDSTFATSGTFALNSYSNVLLSNPVTISSGGFYVLWEMPGGSSITLARDLTLPISYRAFEVLGGSWAGYRARSTEDFLLGVQTSVILVEDIAASQLIQPTPNATLTSPTAPILKIRNEGVLINNAINLKYRFGNNPIVTESLFANILGPGDSLTYTFNTPISAATTTSANFCVWVEMNGDIIPGNDTICIPITYQVNNTSVTELNTFNARVYPNPVQDLMTVDLGTAGSTVQITISDVQGRKVQELQYRNDDGVSRLELNMEALSPGVYHLKLADGKAQQLLRFVKM
jgi:hypothetical protein